VVCFLKDVSFTFFNVILRVDEAFPLRVIKTHEVTAVVESRITGFFAEIDVLHVQTDSPQSVELFPTTHEFMEVACSQFFRIFFKHFKKFELTKEEHLELAKMCKQSGRLYTASVWDITALEWIDPYLDFYKVGSGDLTAWPLIKELALRGKPIVISTGLATLEEVAQTVEFIRRTNKKYEERAMICVLQCTSMYPIPLTEANVSCMDEFRKLLDCSVGYSDHTVGREALKVAVAKGAEIVEFHFTDSREGKEFRDHAVSLTCEEVKALKEEIDLILDIGGDRVKRPQPSEIKSGHIRSFRRGIYSQEVIEQGKKIERNNLVYLRPLEGTDPRDAEHLIGKHAKVRIDSLNPMVEGLNYE